LYRAISMVKQPQIPHGERRPFVPGLNHLEWDEAGMHVSVQVFDESGKLDLNGAQPEMLEQLFLNLGMEFNAAHSLVAAIQDWRDSDDETRTAGAESLYYLGLPRPYRPANQDFQSVEELLLVRGVTPAMLYGGYRVMPDGRVERKPGLMDCLTVHAPGSSVNINYAPLPVLLAVPKLSPAVAQFMLEGRARGPFGSVSDFQHDYPVLLDGDTLSHLTAASSGPYTLIASATTADGVTAHVRAVVQVDNLETRLPGGRLQPGPPFLIHEWDDSYVR
jgi:general secretion pathway protein K